MVGNCPHHLDVLAWRHTGTLLVVSGD
jgi:hypothetical protein